jgi:MFS family permease
MLSQAIPQGRRALVQALAFLRRQPRNFNVIVVRAAFSNFLMGLTSPYESIYVVALGATTVQLGLVNSVGNTASALIALPAGWLVNRFGVKRYFLLGMALLAMATLTFAGAPAWQWIFGAMLLMNVALRLSGTACGVTCTASLRNQDRGTGMGLCSTLSSGAGLAAPLLAAALVAGFGGVNVAGLRPLYLVRFGGTLLMLGMIAWLLRELPNLRSGGTWHFSLRADLAELFTGQAPLRRWLVVSLLNWLPSAMAGPFLLLYAYEIKGADAYTLGVMGAAMAAVGLAMGIPIGRLADQMGRKKVQYLLAPAMYASWGLLVLASGPVSLVAAAGLWGISQFALVVGEAMSNEMVPLPQIGRWKGLLALFRGLVSVPAPLVSGLLWDQLGPASIFVLPLVLDVCLRLPLLAGIPETLKRPACECMS